MKKLLCIALIALLMLNAMGYYAIFLTVQFRNDSAMAEKFDSEKYEDSQTVTIKVPVTLPYTTGSEIFQRVDGMFEHQGEFYRLVKQKFASDTLTMICVRDKHAKRINAALSDYVKTFTDNAQDQKNHSKAPLSFIKDYIGQSFSIKNINSGWQTDVVKNSHSHHLTPSFCAAITHPPERG